MDVSNLSFRLSYGFDYIKKIIPYDFIRYCYPFWIWRVEIIIGYPETKLEEFGIIGTYQIINIGEEL